MTQDEEIRNTLAKVITICTVHLPDGTQTITDKDILGLSFPTSATSGDKLFAFNSFWHDMHNNGDTEEKIFTDAYLFYFDDADFEGNSKPWKYYKGMVW